MRVIFHIDLNAFFANAEISVNPELKNKPMVIAHDGKRSVCSTASYEARRYGIHSAMPLYLAKKKCRHLIVIEPHFTLYRQLSKKFFNIITQYSPYLEIASIDEGYVDVSDYIMTHKIHPADLAYEIQQRMLREIHLPCSIGISPNKFLSKMASDMKKPLGITMLTQSNIQEKMWPLPVSSMFGIGKKTAPKLEKLGIKTIGDVANYDNYQQLRSILGKNALLYYYKANGKDDSKIIYQETESKSIGHTTTFPEDIEDASLLEEKFKEIALNVSQRAKRNDLLSRNISITLRFHSFETITRQMQVVHYTNEFEDIYSYAMMLFREHYQGQKIRLIGISLQNVVKKGHVNEQLSLFETITPEKETQVESIIKTFNKTENLHLMKASDLLKNKSQ